MNIKQRLEFLEAKKPDVGMMTPEHYQRIIEAAVGCSVDDPEFSEREEALIRKVEADRIAKG